MRKGTPIEQDYTYGYSVIGRSRELHSGDTLPNGSPYLADFEGGNVDLRVPYIGYSAESESYTAAGISAYHALQTHVEKRMSHGFQVGILVHLLACDRRAERHGPVLQRQQPSRSAFGVWPVGLRSQACDQLQLPYELPKFFSASSLAGKLADGWAISGLTVIQSGQPYSVVDYSGAVGSIFYGVNDGITNPMVPLSGCSPKQALTGASGALRATAGSQCQLFQPAAADSGRLERRHPLAMRPLRDELHLSRPAEHFPPILAEARRPLDRKDDANYRAVYAEIQLRYLQPHEYGELRHSDRRCEPEHQLQRLPQVVGTPSTIPPCDTTFTALYVCPTLSGLGITNKTIGSPRQIQMSLKLSF